MLVSFVCSGTVILKQMPLKPRLIWNKSPETVASCLLQVGHEIAYKLQACKLIRFRNYSAHSLFFNNVSTFLYKEMHVQGLTGRHNLSLITSFPSARNQLFNAKFYLQFQQCTVASANCLKHDPEWLRYLKPAKNN